MSRRRVMLRRAAALTLLLAAAPAAAQSAACLKSAEGLARATQSEDISENAAARPRILDHNATDLFELDCGPNGAITRTRMRPLVAQPLRRDFLDLAGAVIVKLSPRRISPQAAAALVERCMTAPGDRSETVAIGGLAARCDGAPAVLTLTPR